MFGGLVLFVAATFKAEGWFVTASLFDALALVAAGLACWIAATLP